MNEPIEILLIGKTGSGKSLLGNFLLQDRNAFIVSSNPESETHLTEKRTVGNITIIDSPGLLDSKGRDNEHYKQMITYIKCLKELNGILIVINCQDTRFSSDMQDMIRIICNNFNYETMKNNIGFVFTKFYAKNKKKLEEIKTSKEEQVRQCEEIIENFYKKKLEKHLKAFFIDSDFEDPDDFSLQTRMCILMWIRELTYVNCTKLEVKDNVNYKEEFYEYDTKNEEKEDKDYIYKIVRKLRRRCGINLKDEKETIEDYKEYTDPVEYKIPKDKSIWRKILGAAFIVGGVIAAPFSFGATMAGTTAGVTMIATS